MASGKLWPLKLLQWVHGIHGTMRYIYECLLFFSAVIVSPVCDSPPFSQIAFSYDYFSVVISSLMKR
jgi:hypothetical protein